MPSFERAVLPQTPMASEGLNRRADQRFNDALLEEYLAAADTRFLVFAGERRLPEGVLCRASGEESRPFLLTRREAERFLPDARALVALGDAELEDHDAGCVAVLAARGPLRGLVGERDVHGVTMSSLRGLMAAASARSDVPGLSALSQGQAVASWHATHEFSPESGKRTQPIHSGWVRVCPDEGTEFFPRTDPAVIVALVDEQDRIILGHNALHEEGVYSTLAGFVEPSETPEAAVVRELREEAGVVVDRLRYLGSQPWPFPRSLMLGYIATTRTAPVADGVEITDLRAFTREELRSAEASGEVTLPGALSISRSLIEAWMSAEEGTAA